uniref:Uncharacterized protein n=1 Tax=Leersia perrieri TaxID=77586 RepID=A0A0D9VNV4_9ORYZ
MMRKNGNATGRQPPETPHRGNTSKDQKGKPRSSRDRERRGRGEERRKREGESEGGYGQTLQRLHHHDFLPFLRIGIGGDRRW